MANSAKLKHQLLLGPLKKIERAKQHVNDLHRRVDEYVSSKPFQLRIRERSDPHDRLVYIEAQKPVPDDFALIVGDTVHNLRSGLDHLCWGMIGDKAAKPRQVGFPFVETAENLGSCIATRQMNIAPNT